MSRRRANQKAPSGSSMTKIRTLGSIPKGDQVPSTAQVSTVASVVEASKRWRHNAHRYLSCNNFVAFLPLAELAWNGVSASPTCTVVTHTQNALGEEVSLRPAIKTLRGAELSMSHILLFAC